MDSIPIVEPDKIEVSPEMAAVGAALLSDYVWKIEALEGVMHFASSQRRGPT